MKTIVLLEGRIIMSQDGALMDAMTINAEQHPGAVVQVVDDAAFSAMMAAHNAAADMSRIFAEYRALREQVLNRLTGTCLDMQAEGDTAGAQAVMAARQALKSLVGHPDVAGATTPDALRAAIKTVYYQISADLNAASPAAYLAFRGLDVA